MKTLFKLSEKVGLAPTVIGALVWLACGTVATIAIVDTLWPYPRLAFAFAMAVIVVTGSGRGYPAPCTLRIPSQVDWESEAPPWARGRRSEIAERIANCHGAMNGGDVQILN
jgi:hypothetical protein